MLLDFTVENYRSIAEPVTLSAVASKLHSHTNGANGDSARADDVADVLPVAGWNFDALPVLGIFGANASGKTTVLRALDDLLTLMSVGNLAVFRDRGIGPTFLLDEAMQNEPSKFEIRLATGNEIYGYSLHIIHGNVTRERLEYSPTETKRTRLLFERNSASGDDRVEWKNGPDFDGPHTQLERVIQPREPFLSTMRRLDVAVLRPLTRLLANIVPESVSRPLDDRQVLQILSSEEDTRARVAQLLRAFDTGVVDLVIEKTMDAWLTAYAVHRTRQGTLVRFPMSEESAGTQRLMKMATLIILALDNGALHLIDELDASLHSDLSLMIVGLFNLRRTNPNRAQLVFTSHDSSLMRAGILRPDEIWLTSKRTDGSAEIYSVSDFKESGGMPIDRAYLGGRLGAAPLLPSKSLFTVPIKEAR